MKECDIIRGSKHTLAPPTYFSKTTISKPRLQSGTGFWCSFYLSSMLYIFHLMLNDICWYFPLYLIFIAWLRFVNHLLNYYLLSYLLTSWSWVLSWPTWLVKNGSRDVQHNHMHSTLHVEPRQTVASQPGEKRYLKSRSIVIFAVFLSQFYEQTC